MYGEDNEWCLRIVRSGWRLVFQPAAVVLHRGAQSSLLRWNNLDKLQVQLEADYVYQRLSLSRRRLIMNQLASYVVASGQYLGRRLLGVPAPALKRARAIHGEHLRRCFR
jgi:GT2 family glycosyltransferase